MGKWNDFVQGYGLGKQMVNDAQEQSKKAALADVSKEQASEAYTPDQAAQLESAAKATDPEGKPYYTVGTDSAGKYTIAPNFKNETGAEPANYVPATIAAKGVSFLGKNYDAPLTDSQALVARQQGIAGVMDKYGDAEGAMRYRQQAQQGVMADRQLEQTDLQIAQAKRAGLREDKADAVTATLEGVDKEAGDWMKARLKNPDGTERAATVDDHLATTQFRANSLMEKGRSNEAGALIKDFNAQALVKIQLETAQRNEAIKKTAGAIASGDLNSVKDFYNKFVPDGANVTSVTQGAGGQIFIERTTADGRKLPPTALENAGKLTAALQEFENPGKLYDWTQNEFRNNLAVKADVRADKHLGVAQATLGIHAGTAAMQNQLTAARINQMSQATDDKEVLAGLKQTYLDAVESGDKNAAAAAAASIGVISNKQKSGNAQRLQTSIKDDYVKFTSGALPKNDKEVDKQMSTIYGPGWKSQMPGSGDAVAPTFDSLDAVEAAGKAGKLKKGDKITVGGQSAVYIPPGTAAKSVVAPSAPASTPAAISNPLAARAAPEATAAPISNPLAIRRAQPTFQQQQQAVQERNRQAIVERDNAEKLAAQSKQEKQMQQEEASQRMFKLARDVAARRQARAGESLKQ